MQDVVGSYAEMENNFAKRLLDVVDNLGRASSVVKGRKDSSGAIPFLKTLPEVAGMTEKQLMETLDGLNQKALWLVSSSLDIRYMIKFYDQPRWRLLWNNPKNMVVVAVIGLFKFFQFNQVLELGTSRKGYLPKHLQNVDVDR
uniref:Uncharacterized protein n=1 Tax=Cucumis melo TaxID=3656 RepID=A0A9I9E5C0_CUCME